MRRVEFWFGFYTGVVFGLYLGVKDLSNWTRCRKLDEKKRVERKGRVGGWTLEN